MGRGRERWVSNDLRSRMPLPGERPPFPRFDGSYVAEDHKVTFVDDGSARLNDEAGTWSNDAGVLRVVTARMDCEGSLGPNSAYLRCAPTGAPQAGVDLEFSFRQL